MGNQLRTQNIVSRTPTYLILSIAGQLKYSCETICGFASFEQKSGLTGLADFLEMGQLCDKVTCCSQLFLLISLFTVQSSTVL